MVEDSSRTKGCLKKSSINTWSVWKILGVSLLSLAILCFAGITALLWFTNIYFDTIRNGMILRPNSQTFDQWQNSPVIPLVCVFVFNYTNMDRFQKGIDSQIHLNETGPYCYGEKIEKKDIIFHSDGTISYKEVRTYEFNPTRTKGSLNDTLIVPNLPLLSTVAVTSHYNLFVQMAVSTLLSTLEYDSSLLNVNPHDLFFGYDDNIMALATGAAKYLGEEVPFDKFGILSKRAAVTNETITVYSGKIDVERMGIVTAVNNQTSLNVWADEECNRIDGSDGYFFPKTSINESGTIYLFNKDLCRRMPFVYDDVVNFQDELMAWRFHAAPDVYDTNGTCYCLKEPCAPKGIFDLSPCSLGAPIMMSFPHFLYADPKLLLPFTGLSPNPEKHEFYVYVNQQLGFTVGTVSRIQLNIKVQKADYISQVNEFPNGIILPVAWIQVKAEKLPQDIYDQIYHSSYTVPQIQTLLRCSLLSITILLIVALVFIIRREPKIPQEIINTETEANLLLKNKIPVIKLYPKGM